MVATLEGAEALDLRFADLPRRFHIQLSAKARELATALATRVRDEKLSGQALAIRSGALKSSVVTEVLDSGDTLTATIGSNGDVKYAAIQEYGGCTSAHEILPDKGRALAFLAGGDLRFARRVNHPGSSLPPRAYLFGSLEAARDDIVGGLAAAATQAWNEP